MQTHPKIEKDRTGSESNDQIRKYGQCHLSSDKVSNHPRPSSVGLQKVVLGVSILSDRYKVHVT